MQLASVSAMSHRGSDAHGSFRHSYRRVHANGSAVHIHGLSPEVGFEDSVSEGSSHHARILSYKPRNLSDGHLLRDGSTHLALRGSGGSLHSIGTSSRKQPLRFATEAETLLNHNPAAPLRDDTLAKNTIKFIIFSRQRSGSTVLVRELRRHPNVTCMYEVHNALDAPPWLDAKLEVSEHLRQLPTFMRNYWRWCPGMACGFKVVEGNIHEPANLSQLFEGAEPHSVRVIVLERLNVSAEFSSLQHALRTGNWGVDPKAHAEVSSRLRPTRWKDASLASSLSFVKFAREHAAWFETVRSLGARHAASAVLNVYMEEMVQGDVGLNMTMSRIQNFLGLPKLWTAPQEHRAARKNVTSNIRRLLKASLSQNQQGSTFHSTDLELPPSSRRTLKRHMH